MATPRKPEPPSRIGFLGFLFIMAIVGGLIWLMMLILGIGPYRGDPADVTPTRTEIAILIPSSTEVPSATVTETLGPTTTATLTQTPTITESPTPELFPFVLIGEPEWMSSALIRPSLGCEWLVIAGQVWDLQDAPMIGLTLHLYGELGGFTIDRYVVSGSTSTYGESGYEFALENLVVDSMDSLFIQLEESNGLPLSHPYALQTFEDCQKNMILVNFKQVR